MLKFYHMCLLTQSSYAVQAIFPHLEVYQAEMIWPEQFENVDCRLLDTT